MLADAIKLAGQWHGVVLIVAIGLIVLSRKGSQRGWLSWCSGWTISVSVLES